MLASDTPLPIPASDDTPTLIDTLEHLREVYGAGVSDLMDRVLAVILLPNDQAKVALDFAQLTAMLMCIKVVEVRGQQPTRENLMAVWWPFQKALKDEMPGMLRQFAEAAAMQGRG